MSGICIGGAWLNYSFSILFFMWAGDNEGCTRALLSAIFCTGLALYYQRKEEQKRCAA